jgi:hypothetical protein
MSEMEWEPEKEEKKEKKLADIMAELNKFKLPKRPEKAVLSEQQKYMIKHWTHPSFTTSAKCDYCGNMYSSGYLKLCDKFPEGFCGRKPREYVAPEPRGFSDDELGYYFGIDRSDLD